VTIKGGGYDLMQADSATLQLDSGAYALGGNVRLTRGERTFKFRAATVGRGGDVRDAVSLLDDFDQAEAAKRLEMLPRLTAVYGDEELPPAARYLLAMSLLRSHLAWLRAEGTVTDGPALEPFMREDASRQLQAPSVDPASRVETLIQNDVTKFAFTVKDPAHADVQRAARLLGSIVEGEFAARASAWRKRLVAAP
jgi:hypothetical protein